MGKENGIIIFDATNPQPEIRKNAENASDWVFKDEAAIMYNMAVIIRDRLIDPIARLDRNQVPDPVISFDNLRQSRTLAAYTLARNPQGLLHEITFNTSHYDIKDGKPEWRFGRWAQLPTEPEKPKFTAQGFDIDAEIDRKQEEEDDWRNPTWADEWEDLDSYMERNFGE